MLILLVALASAAASWLHHTAGNEETARLDSRGGSVDPGTRHAARGGAAVGATVPK